MGWKYFWIWWKFYKKLQWRNFHNDLPFLPERMKIEYVIHIKKFKASIKS